MTILVFGRSGQVATELARRGGVHCVGRDVVDLADPDACAALVSRTDARAIINAAAWTAVDRAETEEAAATVVNGDAPGAMARAAAMRGLPFVHISTDYVFDGEGDRPFRPDDPVAPLGAYGRSKLAGEQAVRAAGGSHVILRTSWVFSAHGANFVRTMLRLGAERDVLRVVDDQVGGPTPAAAIAAACMSIAESLMGGAPSGTHHFAGAPVTSWAGFARAIMEEARLPCAIEPIPSTAYPTPARRPLNSRLDGSSLIEAFGIQPPDWRANLAGVVAELRA